MPNRPRRPCLTPGCPNLTDRGRCPEHRRQAEARTRARRGTTAERGYGARWAAYSKRYLRAHPLCVRCEAKGEVVPAEHTDHIRPVHGPDDPLFWTPSNHQGLCHSCHSTKTVVDDRLGFR